MIKVAASTLVRLCICAGSSKLLLFTNVISQKSFADSYMGLDTAKPVLGVSNKAILKQVSSTTETR